MKSVTEKGRYSLTRRRLLRGVWARGGASLAGLPQIAACEPPPEVTRIRFVHTPAICLAPQYLAEELLRLDGFSEVRPRL
jgi:NitT/TauT family transport system substrate-binding protein